MDEVSPTPESPGPDPVQTLIAVPSWSSRGWGVVWLAAITLTAVVLAIAFPAFAVRYGLPFAAMCATFAVRILCARQTPTVATFDARGIRLESSGLERRVPWSDVTRIATTKQGLTLDGIHGPMLHVPWSAKPDVRGILALAPKPVDFQAQTEGVSKQRAWFTLVLWIGLVVVMMAIYSLIAQEPPP